MKPKQTISKTRLIIYITLGYVAILWFCIQAGSYNATYGADGLGEVLNRMFSSNGMFMYPIRFIAVHPVGIAQLVLLATIAYGIGLMYAWAVHKRDAAANDMTEYGTAHWETDFDSYNKIYTAPAGSTEKNGKTNMIFTQRVWMNMDTRKTRRNNNVLVVGGSGDRGILMTSQAKAA